jgi:halimadienyl-diphosphate synthase
MEQAELMGLNLPYHIKKYGREHDMKLKRIDESLWYSPLTTLSFSLEFLGDTVNVERLANVQLSNGSVATSPAATAFFLTYKKDTKAFLYLKEVLSLTGDGSVMTIYPTEVFEHSWAMYNLMLAGLYFEKYTEICDFFLNHLRSSGLGWSAESPITDADDTAVVLRALHIMQHPVDFQVFDTYDTGDYYLTFNSELDPSVSTNIHMLDLVRSCSEFPEREEVIESLVRFLRKRMNSGGFWIDKWHISPYYPTSHVILALCHIDQHLAEKAVSWILDTQHENGLWGEDGGTLEETAYAVQALMYYHQSCEHIDTGNMVRAVSALTCENSASLLVNPANLWIGKILYASGSVLLSSIVSAQFLARTERQLSSVC